MPQFDTFSFFSQLFWVFIAFSYLYLTLCLYILPAFAATLKIRSKKLAQTEMTSISSSVTSNVTTNLLFFETLLTKFTGISFFSKTLNSNVNNIYSYLIFKNEIYYQFKFTMLNQFRIISFFV